jgi:L-lactate dehydrogenase complex protein LldG
VAENGSVWISGEDLVTRNSVFICEHLIAVVDEGCITGTMSEAMGRVGRVGGGWGFFISGPSKTADIEQALVMGAHGARTMTVYILRRAEHQA